VTATTGSYGYCDEGRHSECSGSWAGCPPCSGRCHGLRPTPNPSPPPVAWPPTPNPVAWSQPPAAGDRDELLRSWLDSQGGESTVLAHARRALWLRVALGVAIAAVAGLISLATYASAEGGEIYLVWWGPVLFGGYLSLRAGYALWRMS
jgi:hypothetical protein